MIKIDKSSPIPLYKQIILQVKKDMLLGRLKKGDKLPPIRELALKLGVNVNTVHKAFERLTLEGVIDSKQGSGYYISENIEEKLCLMKEVREFVKKMKEMGIKRDLLLILIQEVWEEND